MVFSMRRMKEGWKDGRMEGREEELWGISIPGF